MLLLLDNCTYYATKENQQQQHCYPGYGAMYSGHESDFLSPEPHARSLLPDMQNNSVVVQKSCSKQK
jgi:hypothetical protein